MTLDITAGIDPAWDRILPSRPQQADLRESVSMWISDDRGRFGLPRFCLEAVGSQWDERGIQANIAFPDGRVLIGTGGFKALPTVNAKGQAAVLGAGPLAFECVEPLRRWRMTFRGKAYETTVADQARGITSGPLREVTIDVVADMAVPPWLPGEAAAGNQAENVSSLTAKHIGGVGGSRHEQLFRCRGQFAIRGEQALEFTGTGLRIHRVGVREMAEFRGHCWQSALFPSGRGFGSLAFPGSAGDNSGFNDAFLFDGQRMIPARVVEAPWMKRFVASGGAVDIVLESELGITRIGGTSHDSTLTQAGVPLFGDWVVDGQRPPVPFPFHQGGARYTWDGETAYGMVERSYPVVQFYT